MSTDPDPWAERDDPAPHQRLAIIGELFVTGIRREFADDRLPAPAGGIRIRSGSTVGPGVMRIPRQASLSPQIRPGVGLARAKSHFAAKKRQVAFASRTTVGGQQASTPDI